MICGLNKQETHECGRDTFKDTTNYPWKSKVIKLQEIPHNALSEYTHRPKQSLKSNLLCFRAYVSYSDILFSLKIAYKINWALTSHRKKLETGRKTLVYSPTLFCGHYVHAWFPLCFCLTLRLPSCGKKKSWWVFQMYWNLDHDDNAKIVSTGTLFDYV